jgi:hypothetical protein
VTIAAPAGGSPWPDLTNTGVPSGTVLTSASSNAISSPGTYNALSFHGTVAISASNVTLENSMITGGNSDAFELVIAPGLSNVVIQNCTITGAGTNSSQTGVYGIYIEGDSQVTINANNIGQVGTGVNVRGGQVTIENNLIYPLNSGPGSHYNGIDYDGGGGSDFSLLIQHNTIYDQQGQTDAIMIDTYFGPADNVTIDNNILAGGNYAIYAVDQGNGSPTNISITNNHFGLAQYGNYDYSGTPMISGNVNDAATILSPLGLQS